MPSNTLTNPKLQYPGDARREGESDKDYVGRLKMNARARAHWRHKAADKLAEKEAAAILKMEQSIQPAAPVPAPAPVLPTEAAKHYTAYQQFMKDNRMNVSNAHPEMNPQQVTCEVARLWQAKKEEEKHKPRFLDENDYEELQTLSTPSTEDVETVDCTEELEALYKKVADLEQQISTKDLRITKLKEYLNHYQERAMDLVTAFRGQIR